MDQRDQELVNYDNMISYEEFVQKLQENGYPDNCLSPDGECPYRSMAENGETVYLKLYDPDTDEDVIGNTLEAIDSETGKVITTLKPEWYEDGIGYKMSYNKKLNFSVPYSTTTIYNSDKDKYMITKNDCVPFLASDYEYNVDDIKKIITLTKCKSTNKNIYIPKSVKRNNNDYSIRIEYDSMYVNSNILRDTTKFVYADTKSGSDSEGDKYVYSMNPFFENGLSIEKVVIENGVEIIHNYRRNDASFLFCCLLNLVYAKLPNGIETADFTFAHCVSLKAVSIDELPYSAEYLFLGCEFLEDLSYLEIPDDESDRRTNMFAECKSLRNGNNLPQFKDNYNNPVYLTEYIKSNGEDAEQKLSIESFEFPDIENIASYKDMLKDCKYLRTISGTISKYATDISGLLEGAVNVSGFLNIDCIWFDELFFEKENAFNISTNNDRLVDPLVLIPKDYNLYFVSSYVNNLNDGCNVYVQDDLENFDYEISLGNIILKRYNGFVKRLYIPDTFRINNASYRTVVYAGAMNGMALLEDGCFSRNTNITHVSMGDGVTFLNNSLEGLFYNCTNLIRGIDLAKGDKYDYMYAYCTKLRGAYFIDTYNLETINTAYGYNLGEACILPFYNISAFNNLIIYTSTDVENITSTLNTLYNIIGDKYKKYSSLTNLSVNDTPRFIRKNDKRYIVLDTVKSFETNKTLSIPFYYWYNGSKYYTCIANPTVTTTDSGKTIVDGFFQKLNTFAEGFVGVNYNPGYMSDNDMIIEFENDNMDYMFYNCTKLLAGNGKNFSLNIKSAKYSFFNTGILFTRFNFGIVDVRFACAVERELVDTLLFDDHYSTEHLPNSIKYMDYFMTNHKISNNDYVKITLPSKVETANYAFVTSNTCNIEGKFDFIVNDEFSLISRLPLTRLREINMLFGVISNENSGIPLASNNLFVPEYDKYILPARRPEIDLYQENSLMLYKDEYNIVYRTYIGYHEADVKVDIYGNIYGINEMEITIDFSNFHDPTTTAGYNIFIYGKDPKTNTFTKENTMHTFVRYNYIHGGVETVLYKPTGNIGFGSEIVVVVSTETYDNSLWAVKPWYYITSDSYDNTGNKLDVLIWNTDKYNLYYNEDNYALQGYFHGTLQDEKIYIDDEIYQDYLSSDIDPTSIVCESKYYMNYKTTDNVIDDIGTDSSGGTYIRIPLNVDTHYKFIGLNGIRSWNTIRFQLANCVIEGTNTEISYNAPMIEVKSNEYIDLRNLNLEFYTMDCNCLEISGIKEFAQIQPIYEIDIAYSPAGEDEEVEEEYYLKAVFTISANDWIYNKESNNYMAKIPLIGSSDIPQYEYTLDSNEEEELEYIYAVVPRNDFVCVYTNSAKEVPTVDLIVNLKLYLNDEYGTIAPGQLPTDEEGKWICPYNTPFVLCASHAYNCYRSYWYSCYYGKNNGDEFPFSRLTIEEEG